MAKKRSTRNHFELKNLKKHREELGLSLDDFANGLSHSTSKSTIFQYENGYCAANGDILFDISQTYNISIDYLYGLRKAKDPKFDFEDTCHFTGLSEESLKLLNYFTQAEPEKIQLINFLLEQESKDYLVKNDDNTYSYEKRTFGARIPKNLPPVLYPSTLLGCIIDILKSDNLSDKDCLKNILFYGNFRFNSEPDSVYKLDDLKDFNLGPFSGKLKEDTKALFEKRLSNRLEKLSKAFCKMISNDQQPLDNDDSTKSAE